VSRRAAIAGGVEIAITAEGSRLLRRMWPVYAGVVREVLCASITEEEALALRDILAKVMVTGEVRPRRRVRAAG
jgi:uncharacterized metal-binding protein YceD (DUF177 family)